MGPIKPKVKNGSIFVTDRFKSFAEEQRGTRLTRPFKMKELKPTDLPEVTSRDGYFNLAKDDREPAILHKLYRIS